VHLRVRFIGTCPGQCQSWLGLFIARFKAPDRQDGNERVGKYRRARTREMARTDIISDQELAIICDLMGGWGAKWDSDDQQPRLSRLITAGFIELAPEGSLIKYQNTAKAELLLAELCVGICES
jgi:hypothetical protein